MEKRTWIAAAALTGLGALTASLPAAAGTQFALQVGAPAIVYVTQPPLPLVYEAVPVRRHGYIWVAGHQQWTGHRYVWVAGHYLRERPGYFYEPTAWVQNGERWGYRPGHWGRGDRDHDGVPNRYDRDRDGDGVPNRYDRAPNNPHRR
ncbi:MAG: thrombospondin type 3 repeat-containing protein [Ramlibacter sp.]|nr:thrombospondin type 3 repeat-containing protein [Ramlibacter sp.]